MRRLAFAAVSVALIQAPSAAQIAIQSTPDASPRCEAAPEAQFQARRISNVGNVFARPIFFEAASRIAIVAGDRTTSLFETANGNRIVDLYPPGSESSYLSVSPDGEVALWSDAGAAVDMRRTGTGDLISRLDVFERDNLIFSPDSTRLITRAQGALVMLDGKTGGRIGAPISVDPTGKVEFSADGARLIVRSAASGDVAIDLRSGAPAYAIAVGEGELVKLDQEGARALVVGSAGWRLLDPKQNAELAKGTGEEARFSAGGAYVLAEGQAGVRIIDARTGRIAARPGKLASTPSRRAVEAGVLISPDGKTAITRTPDGIARLWDLVRGRGLAELGLFSTLKDNAVAEEPRQPREFQYTPEGNRLITRDIEGRLTIWDAATGRRIATIGQFTKLDYVWVVDDGAFAVAILADGGATLWNTRSGWRIASMGQFTANPLATQFLISPDRRLLLISDREKTELWDVERGVNLGRRAGPIRLSDVVFSANGAWLVLRANPEESAFEIWNARTGGRAGEARPADSATFHTIAGADVLLTRSAASFALWDMKRGERSVSCQFSDPNLSLMEVFPAKDALVMVLNVGGGQSELWRFERK